MYTRLRMSFLKQEPPKPILAFRKREPIRLSLPTAKEISATSASVFSQRAETELIEEIRAGNSYVNVHTYDGVDPPYSGPGDYRVGEIRGQLK